MLARSTRWLIALLASGTLAGCAMTQSNLVSSAERLERNAEALQAELLDDRSERTQPAYYRDAQEFATQARAFRRIVEDRRDDDDVQDAFRELSSRYHALRDEVEDTRDRDAELDLRPVTEAYLDVERELRRYDERRDRLASDG